MTITIYKDPGANAIFIQEANGVQFLNSLRAGKVNPTDTSIDVTDLAREIKVFSQIDFNEFVDESGTPYGSSATETCNNLNALFLSAGSPSGVPVFTSPSQLTMTVGDTLNYELVATGGVGYEWDNLPSGVVTVEGNVRKLIGGSSLSDNTYNFTATAVNYFGSSSLGLTLTVSNPPYNNTRSVNFNNLDYLTGTANNVPFLSRTGNGSGSSDAWTISLWFKPGSSNNNNQTVFYYGNSSGNGGVEVKYQGNPNDKNLLLTYGSGFNNLVFETPQNSFTPGVWHHVMMTYDGGTTGAGSGSVNNYYSRFSIFIDGVLQTTSKRNQNYGFSGSVTDGVLYIGRSVSSGYMRNSCRVDEVALWDSDQSANVADIYNSGTSFDLTTLAAPVDTWWRMGDGDTFPNLLDNGVTTTANLTMTNMTAADIVTDAP